MADPSKFLCTLGALNIQNLDCDYFLELPFELVSQMIGHNLLYYILAEIKNTSSGPVGLTCY